MALKAQAYNTVVYLSIILWGVPYNPRLNHVLASLPFGAERLSSGIVALPSHFNMQKLSGKS